MGSERIRRVAAASRFALAAIAIVALPIAYPRTSDYFWVLAGYVCLALVFQGMVVRNVGGEARALVSGLVDVGIITFLAHLVGTVTTMLVALYVYQATVNTLVSGRRVGVSCAVFGMIAYATIIALELGGVLPYAPGQPPGSPSPTPPQQLAAAAVVLATLTASTFLVDTVTSLIEKQQASLRDANARLEELARRDALTGLFNRRHVMERLETELHRVRRGHDLAVVMLDLDHFKRINDETGHERGDALLRAIARAVEGAVRATDLVGRHGGDELIVLLPDTRDEAAILVARRIVDTIRETGASFDPDRRVTASVGVATARAKDGPLDLLRRADEAAYSAKAAGGDRVTQLAA